MNHNNYDDLLNKVDIEESAAFGIVDLLHIISGDNLYKHNIFHPIDGQVVWTTIYKNSQDTILPAYEWSFDIEEELNNCEKCNGEILKYPLGANHIGSKLNSIIILECGHKFHTMCLYCQRICYVCKKKIVLKNMLYKNIKYI